jgi:hypothetical protein
MELLFPSENTSELLPSFLIQVAQSKANYLIEIGHNSFEA